MKRVLRSLITLALLLPLALPAHAEEGVLIETVPAGLETSTVMTVVRNALGYREWTIVETQPSAVSAKISRGRIDARIRIFLVENSLRYRESAITTELSMKVTKSTTPSRWIEYLRSDISTELEARKKAKPEAAAKPAPTQKPRGDTVERMQELKRLLDGGLISTEEYERKRAQILNEL